MTMGCTGVSGDVPSIQVQVPWQSVKKRLQVGHKKQKVSNYSSPDRFYHPLEPSIDDGIDWGDWDVPAKKVHTVTINQEAATHRPQRARAIEL